MCARETTRYWGNKKKGSVFPPIPQIPASIYSGLIARQVIYPKCPSRSRHVAGQRVERPRVWPNFFRRNLLLFSLESQGFNELFFLNWYDSNQATGSMTIRFDRLHHLRVLVLKTISVMCRRSEDDERWLPSGGGALICSHMVLNGRKLLLFASETRIDGRRELTCKSNYTACLDQSCWVLHFFFLLKILVVCRHGLSRFLLLSYSELSSLAAMWYIEND